MSSKKVVLGIVNQPAQAEAIVARLRENGFQNSDISVLYPDRVHKPDIVLEQHTKAPEGALAGVSAGGALGATLGLLAGFGAIAIPGIGPFIAAGPIVAALSGLAVGASLGGVAGALVGIGIPEVEAKRYEGQILDGNILVSVHSDHPAARMVAKGLLERNGATHILTIDENGVSTSQA